MDRHESTTAPPGSVTCAGHSCVHCHESITARPSSAPSQPWCRHYAQRQDAGGPPDSKRLNPHSFHQSFSIRGTSHQGFSIRSCSRLRFPLQGLFPEVPRTRAFRLRSSSHQGSSHQGFPPQELFPPRFLASELCPSGTSIFLMLTARESRPQSQRPGLLSHSDTGAARSMPPCLSCRRSPALGYGRESWSEGSRTPPDHHPKKPKYDLGATTHPPGPPKTQTG